MNASNIIGPRHRSDRFTYIPATRTFVAEASDFNGTRLSDQLYNDACDEGMVIVSTRTGKEVAFYLDEEERDREGDVIAWHFKAVKGDAYQCVVFND